MADAHNGEEQVARIRTNRGLSKVAARVGISPDGLTRSERNHIDCIRRLAEAQAAEVTKYVPRDQKIVCAHCKQCKVNRPRGLCWHCYYAPGVRERYASGSKYARRGVGNGMMTDAPLGEPTEALPGTPEKVEVMRLRALAGQQVFNPLDAVWSTGCIPKVEPMTEAKKKRDQRYRARLRVSEQEPEPDEDLGEAT